MGTPARLRKHPQERFSGSEHFIDLTAAAARLKSESHAPVAGHRQIAVLRSGPLTLVLYAFEAGGHLKEHHADGIVTIYAISGRLQVKTPEGMHGLSAGQLVVLSPTIPHTVTATVASEMLLTVCR